jgi:predicted GIY-YIG superfamily endonuclease
MKNDTSKYILKEGNKIVYVGITNDPGRRETQHRNDGKKFDKMEKVGHVCTRKGAENWETERLESYMKSQGRLPKYNETTTGK